jgi:hypothetical protein
MICLGTISPIFDLSFDDSRCRLQLGVHPEFVDVHNNWANPDRVKHLADNFLKEGDLSYSRYSFDSRDLSFGFDGSFQKIEPISSKDPRMNWFESGDNALVDDNFKLAASLYIFFRVAQLYYYSVEKVGCRNLSGNQQVQISTTLERGRTCSCHIGGGCSKEISEAVANFSQTDLEKIIDSLVQIETLKMEASGNKYNISRYSYHVDSHNNFLQINCPSMSSGLWLTVGCGEICGHNIDYPNQQIMLICALAKVLDLAKTHIAGD